MPMQREHSILHAPTPGLSVDRLAWGIVTFLVAYLPFEQFLLKFLPVSERAYTLLYAGSELLIYLGFSLVILSRLATSRSLKRTPLDLPILGLVLVAISSAAISESDWLNSANFTRNLLRYVALYYIVVNIRLSVDQAWRTLWLIAWIGIFQGLIVAAQSLIGESQLALFLPREIDTELLGQTLASKDLSQERVGALVGTLGQPGALAAFILVPTTAAWALVNGNVTMRRRVLAGISILLALIAVYFTYKRLMLLMAIGIPVLYALHRNFRLTITLMLSLSLPVIMVAAAGLSSVGSGSIVTDAESRQSGFDFGALMLELLSGEYWRHSLENSRLWLLVEGFRATFVEMRPFGFGPDEQKALEAFAYSSSERMKILDYFAYKDVYWIALTIHLGFLGLVAYWMTIFRGWRLAHIAMTKASDRRLQAILLMCSVYMIVFFFGSFAERLPVLRPNAFFFWLCCALVVKLIPHAHQGACRPSLAEDQYGQMSRIG